MRTEDRTFRGPRFDAAVQQLAALRAKGLDRVHDVDAPDIAFCVAATTGQLHGDLQRHHYEAALGAAVDAMGDGEAADSAAVLFGIAPHVRGLHPIELRKRAAELSYDRPAEAATVDAWRKTREPRVLAAVATALLRAAADAREERPAPPGERRLEPASYLDVDVEPWQRRRMPVGSMRPGAPGRVRELTWPEFGAGVDRIRDQLRDYGTNIDIDVAIGVNEGGLLMATLLASASFRRCSIGYVRTVRRGPAVAVEDAECAIGRNLAEAAAVIVCDFEVQTAPVLDAVATFLFGRGLAAETPMYLAVMGMLATSDQTLPPGPGTYSLDGVACLPALRATPLADVFVGYMMASPGIDPPLRLR